MSGTYVKKIYVNYGEGNDDGCLNTNNIQDINKGFGGDYVYLRPEYTSDKNSAATSFYIELTSDVKRGMQDLAKGAGGCYRYLFADYSGTQRIYVVWLSENPEGDGHTRDINEGRNGRYLYLCWNYAQ